MIGRLAQCKRTAGDDVVVVAIGLRGNLDHVTSLVRKAGGGSRARVPAACVQHWQLVRHALKLPVEPTAVEPNACQLL